MRINLFGIYQRFPLLVRSIISHAVFRPKRGKYAAFMGNVLVRENVEIGDYSYVGENGYLKNITIGKYCSIGINFRVICGSHTYRAFTTYTLSECIASPLYKARGGGITETLFDNTGDVTVGNDVWIGTDVLVVCGNKKLKIGNGAVIGAGSVVTKDVPPFAVVAGNPARVIKYRFSREVIQKLEELKWWDWPASELRKRLEELNEVCKREPDGQYRKGEI